MITNLHYMADFNRPMYTYLAGGSFLVTTFVVCTVLLLSAVAAAFVTVPYTMKVIQYNIMYNVTLVFWASHLIVNVSVILC